MDPRTFDRLARLIAAPASRRRTLLALAGILPAAAVADTDAARKATRRHEKLACRNANSQCVSNDECCSNRCVPKFGGTEFRCAKGRSRKKSDGNKQDNTPSTPLIPTGEPCVPTDRCLDPDARCTTFNDDNPAGTYCLIPDGGTCTVGDFCTSHGCSNCTCCDGVAGFDAIGTYGSIEGVYGMAMSPDGLQLFFADYVSNHIDIWGREDACTAVWSPVSSFGGQNLIGPRGIDLTADGLTLYVADQMQSRVSIFRRTAGQNDWAFVDSVSTNGQPNQVASVAVSPDGLTMVTTNLGNYPNIEIFTRTSTSTDTWSIRTSYGSLGTGPGEFDDPWGIVFSEDGLSVYIADSGNARISVCSRPDTTSIDFAPAFTYGTFGNGTGEMNDPSAVRLYDGDLTMVVSNLGNGVVTTYSRPTSTSSDFTFEWGFVANMPRSVLRRDQITYTGNGDDTFTLWGYACDA